MMNVRILIVAAIACFEYAYGQQDGAISLYSSRYNNLNIDTILASNRLVTNYVECLLSRKPCPPEGKDLKRILPEALRTKCSRCSHYQKESALKVITKLYYDYPRQYNQLRMKWDQTGEYHRRFEEYLRGLQFNTIDSPAVGGNDAGVRFSQQPINPPIQTFPVSSQRPVPTVDTRFQTQTPTAQNFNSGTTRPARNPEINSAPVAGTNSVQLTPSINNVPTQPSTQPSPVVFNRFGNDDDLVGSAAFPALVTSSVQPNAVQEPQVTRTETTTTTTTASPTVRPVNHYVPQVQYRPTVTNPLLGLISSIGYKISNTAEFLAGIMSKTVQTS